MHCAFFLQCKKKFHRIFSPAKHESVCFPISTAASLSEQLDNTCVVRVHPVINIPVIPVSQLSQRQCHYLGKPTDLGIHIVCNIVRKMHITGSVVQCMCSHLFACGRSAAFFFVTLIKNNLRKNSLFLPFSYVLFCFVRLFNIYWKIVFT